MARRKNRREYHTLRSSPSLCRNDRNKLKSRCLTSTPSIVSSITCTAKRRNCLITACPWWAFQLVSSQPIWQKTVALLLQNWQFLSWVSAVAIYQIWSVDLGTGNDSIPPERIGTSPGWILCAPRHSIHTHLKPTNKHYYIFIFISASAFPEFRKTHSRSAHV